jgi:hypothetical protein
MQERNSRRSVVVEGNRYFIEVRRSEPRHIDRFATRCYAVVELDGQWQATVPVPESVRSTAHLWYRELIELVRLACQLVNRRSAAA